MANQIYYNGNFYQCVTTTLAGENPDTAPDKWRKVQCPAHWRWILTKLTYAHLLEMDGQKDKANAERDEAINDERRGLDKLTRVEANRERFLNRPKINLRNPI